MFQRQSQIIFLSNLLLRKKILKNFTSFSEVCRIAIFLFYSLIKPKKIHFDFVFQHYKWKLLIIYNNQQMYHHFQYFIKHTCPGKKSSKNILKARIWRPIFFYEYIFFYHSFLWAHLASITSRIKNSKFFYNTQLNDLKAKWIMVHLSISSIIT